eukprot:COSAG01_NODE_71477_length_255_cov_5.269231_1_plen_67_part_01
MSADGVPTLAATATVHSAQDVKLATVHSAQDVKLATVHRAQDVKLAPATRTTGDTLHIRADTKNHTE